MPSWSIHLTIAQKLNKKLKVDKDLFYYGNLIPDIDKETNTTRNNTHYYDDTRFPNCPKERMINIDNFLKDYKLKLKNPLILGYYCHLLADNFYNKSIYTNCWIQDENNNIIGIKMKTGKKIKLNDIDGKKRKKEYKHKDLELYGKYLYNSKMVEVPENSFKIQKHIAKLKDNFLTKELVNKRINYLQTNFNNFNKLSLKEKIFKHNYNLFTKEKLDLILNDCVNYILCELKKVGIDIE